ncbi:MAG TPA: phosphotransferase family protein [Baekduia sp.]|jgi:aminoglycoside phosphotransferase (APT) family kinase protein
MTGPSSITPPAELDVGRVAAWLSANVDVLQPPYTFELLTGGRSNLTFRGIDGTGRTFVLRRPPLGHTLRTAHDMGREHRILEALHGSGVPVPETYGLCDDPDVIGAPFYVMELVEGPVLRTPEDVTAAFAEDQRAELATSLIDVLAAIHGQDPDAVGLGQLGRKDGYLERQLKRWKRQYDEVRSRDLPAIEEVHRRLVAARPEQQRPGIVHGDYRMENVIYGTEPQVRAVLDWELCTLGDPLADLGGLLVWWVEAGEDGGHVLGRTPTVLPGFPNRAAIVERYAQRTGFDVSGIDYYEAFALWRLACIAEGVYARYRDGAMGDDIDVPIEMLGDQVLMLADRALQSIEQVTT